MNPPMNPNAPSYPLMPAGGNQPVVQHTTVTIHTDPPKDYIIWSLFSFFYGNVCCLGLMALIFSVKARDRKVVGDLDGARIHGSTARIYNIISTVLISLFIFSSIIAVIVISVQASRAVNYYYRGYG
ncbi:dispanin subfamily A member 2b-like [Gouania willdenowi]|uniref:Dispanin subfamily A member 2b-like n=1 Tax=Gouania willdenowi TaxID=441366 RepID=A0A8C5D4P8_GOUWI|nr:dispanin subfamily A member 2b-like [Gouania willdenowi]